MGPEQPVSDPVYVSAAPSQSLPKIAFDGTNYLVVWQDDRGNQFSDVYATRVAPDGTVLDPHGIPIATSRASERSPAVAFDGTNYLVTWTGPDYPNGDIYGARVSPSGTYSTPGASRSPLRRAFRTSRRSPSTARTTSSPGRTATTPPTSTPRA